MQAYPITFSPLKVGKFELKNRLVVPAMDSAMCEDDGTIGQMAWDYYGNRAEGGFSMVITEIAAIDERGMGMPGQPRLFDDMYLPGMTKLAEAIRAGGAVAVVQLHHAGRETMEAMIGETPFSPSVLPSPVYRELLHEMTTQEVHDMVQSYIDSAVRVQKAGFDGVEFHSAHGYMGLQFLSPRTNKRIDEYGGDIEGRATFHTRIVEGIREACGDDFLIIVRVDTIEGRIGGLPESESIAFARMMEVAGADAINVSAGTYAAWDVIVPPPDFDEGWNWRGARKIKDYVNIPVGLAGRIAQPKIIEDLLERGETDFICLGRASIADPALPNKMEAGKTAEITPCIGCTQRCMSFNDHDTLQEGDWGVSCMFNPFSNNRKEMQYGPAEVKKKVLVVGAGIGGLYAAQIAAKRGHDVTVFEKNAANRAGGQFLIAAYPPFKQDITRVIRHYLHMCDKYGVDIKWNTEANDDLVREFAPDVLIDASGAEPMMLNLPGFDSPQVVQANALLEGKHQLANSALIIGGGMVGVETAEFCRDYCEDVTIIEMLPEVAADLYMTVRDSLLKRFKEEEIDIHVNTKALRFEDGVLYTEQDGEEVAFEGYDTIVVAIGCCEQKVFKEKDGLAPEVYTIGDAKEPRSAVEAIFEAARVAMKI
ncbi:MAG: NAD(P)/FAD-dependent oxidoreductase [Eubacteriales bacterium]|nr:NAD(P)/FAD-dependent oxidoreductase [Eubacteriales bacterium]MDD4324015.1 NAD(P)/FAD-dependent oxidoreductase [Eubacteriales bacterium]MDD4540914.1 NAD(P)/FAD-dependent oxidoreductase [Eubacteriales bacterium]